MVTSVRRARAVAVLAAAAFAPACDRPATGARDAAPPDLGAVPAFSLTERSGRGLALADLRGRVWIAGFVFTRCPGPCPRLTTRMARLQKDLPADPRLRLVSVSVDPAHDAPAVLADYADRYGADRERWLFLTGTKEEVRRLVVDGFHLALADAPPEEGGITHSTRLALVDGAGRIRGYYDSEEAEAMARLARDAATLLAR